jgi:hypothetical protein
VEASGDGGGELLPRELEGLLERAIARTVSAPELAAVHDNLHRAQLGSLGRGLGAFLLRALVGLPPAQAPSSLVADLALLGTDLKGQLLAALGDLPEGAAREAVARTLAGLEAEQLLNLARGQSHEALHWSVAVPDGERWTTAHFFHRRAGGGGGGSGKEGAHRMTVAVDFTHTGPVRADLVVGSASLAMRVVASRQEVAERMGARVAELEARLATGGRRVTLVVARAPADEVRVDAGAHDIRFLREHHLMDKNG